MSEYRIEYAIQRRLDGEEDFTEVGFGSSGEWDTVAQANHMMGSAIDRQEWEHTVDQPHPSEVEVDA